MAGKIEKEVKFFIHDLKEIEKKILNLGGKVLQPRTFEKNLRFDTPRRELSTSSKVLRLRKDSRTKITFKGPSDPKSEVSARLEYEIEIDDLVIGQQILEALGYEIVTVYEKFRSSYFLEQCELSLDEMPFGSFMEIEGPDEKLIHAVANLLQLDWESRSLLSYMQLFSRLKAAMEFSMRDLTFENFSGIEIHPNNMQLVFAN